MATGGSDETFEFICTPCYKGSKHVEGVVYCVECKECFCETHYISHQDFAAMVVHKVLDKAGMQAGGAANANPLPTETCETHPGKLILVYCEDHAALCCVECVSSSHRSCSAVYIPEASRGVENNARLKDLADSMKDLNDEAGTMKASRQTDLQKSQQDKGVILSEIQTVKDNLIQRIKELEQLSVDIVKTKYDPNEKAIADEIKYLDQILTDVQSVMASLNTADMSEAQLFINEKRVQRHKQELRKKLRDNVPQDRVPTHVQIWTHPEMNKMLDTLKELKSMVTTEKIYRAKLHGEYTMKVASDTNACTITGCCQLPDGTLVVTDFENDRLKRLDTSYKVTDLCEMLGGPWGVTCTAPDEVAVTLISTMKVKFVSVRRSMSKTKRSFRTCGECRGIYYSNKELFVSCGGGLTEGPGHVTCYSLNGGHIRTIQTDLSGKQIFSCPRTLSSNSEGTTLVVADQKFGIVSFERSGTQFRHFNDPGLQHSFGLFTLDNGHILVGGRESHNVLQFDRDGRKLTELLKDTDVIKNPHLVYYVRGNSRLIISMPETDHIKVFELV